MRNHGLEALVDRHFEESRKFFELPLEEKMDIAITNTHHHR